MNKSLRINKSLGLIFFFASLIGCVTTLPEACFANTKELLCNQSKLQMTVSFPKPDTVSFSSPVPNGIPVQRAERLWCKIPDNFSDRILQFVVVRYRKDFSNLPLPGQRDTLPVFLGISAVQGKPILWSDQFGAEKYVPPTLPEMSKQSTFLGFSEILKGKPAEGIFIENLTKDPAASAPILIHKVDLVFLHHGDRCKPENITRFNRAEMINSLTLRYRLDSSKGLELRPGQSFEFLLPENLNFPWITYLVLKHRKDPSLMSKTDMESSQDTNPAYMLVEVHDSKTDTWIRWADRYGSAKYSEVRSADNPEDETLHNGLRTFGKIKPDKIRVTNIGTGDSRLSTARVHELMVVFYPDNSSAEKSEQIFTPETAFNDPVKGILIPLIGGGPRLDGKFPGAIPIGPGFKERIASISALPASHTFQLAIDPPPPARRDSLGHIVIPLPEKRHLLMAEFAIGDLDVTALNKNKDGFFGRTGCAELTVWLRNKSVPGRHFPAIIRNNIGMAGIITLGLPTNAGQTQPGDELVVSVSNDVAFLMGYRVTYSSDL
ncbi:MAG: hypothetical protein HQM10_03555 [Candidatus Riflebacteria bacterium]|nr:hypothetical protein [Candidatus Riflebacteria bacterium]